MGMTVGETRILISMEIRCLKAFFSYTVAAMRQHQTHVCTFSAQTWLNTHVQAWEGSAMGLALPR